MRYSPSLVSLVLLFLFHELQAGERILVHIPSTLDQTQQPCFVVLPPDFQAEGPSRGLLVSLHSWSSDYKQRNAALETAAGEEGWIVMCPNFRGPNNSPKACGSKLAQQDILDAVEWAKKKYPINHRKVYLTGVSGGGHMTMLMVGLYPETWAAASAWVGISDLVAWEQRHAGGKYGKMVRNSCGGPPGQTEQIDLQYRLRSPISHIHRATAVPLDLAAGIQDGHKGSVPIDHTLNLFNRLAAAGKHATITDEEIAQLSKPGPLAQPAASDQVTDESFGRRIYLRRRAGPARVTIFEGGHEGIAQAAISWLKRHSK